HVTCRHISKRLTHEKVTGLLTERARSAFYRTSYSTEQEAEADKLGLLYMALGGFDPRAASGMWARRLRVEGNVKRTYLNDHPLNEERMKSTKQWGETASKYYRGEGVANPDYGTVLVENELAPR